MFQPENSPIKQMVVNTHGKRLFIYENNNRSQNIGSGKISFYRSGIYPQQIVANIVKLDKQA